MRASDVLAVAILVVLFAAWFANGGGHSRSLCPHPVSLASDPERVFDCDGTMPATVTEDWPNDRLCPHPVFLRDAVGVVPMKGHSDVTLTCDGRVPAMVGVIVPPTPTARR